MDAVRGSPVFLCAEGSGCRRRDQGDVDGEEKNGGKQGRYADDSDGGHDGRPVSMSLPDKGRNRSGDEGQDYGNSVGNPNEGDLDITG